VVAAVTDVVGGFGFSEERGSPEVVGAKAFGGDEDHVAFGELDAPF
jgi:hypothetical protein